MRYRLWNGSTKDFSNTFFCRMLTVFYEGINSCFKNWLLGGKAEQCIFSYRCCIYFSFLSRAERESPRIKFESIRWEILSGGGTTRSGACFLPENLIRAGIHFARKSFFCDAFFFFLLLFFSFLFVINFSFFFLLFFFFLFFYKCLLLFPFL